MNHPRSTRYHRAHRRAAVASAALQALVLAGLILSPGSRAVRGAAGGTAWVSAAAFLLVAGAAGFPFAWYRGRLDRRYGLSRVPGPAWLREYAKAAALRLVAGTCALSAVYGLMGVFPRWWWLPAAAAGTLAIAILTVFVPMVVLARSGRTRPLGRESVRERVAALAGRAGIQPPAVHEWRMGSRSPAASAALVGAGLSRRILVSDTLLADYSDDEIEAVLAHEIGHHVHRDVLKGLAAELAVALATCLAAAAALSAWWRPLGLSSPADPAGVPLLLLVAGGVAAAAAPVLNALSRRNERRADEYALALCSRPDAFVSAIRRIAAQNLADEAPSRAAFLMFHTHPLVEERIARARDRSRARAS
jgi:STE24 endopeptidase